MIALRRDFEWAEATIRQHGLSESFAVLLSPVVPRIREVKLAEWVLSSGLQAADATPTA